MRLRTILLLLSLLAFLSAIGGGAAYYFSLKENAFREAETQAITHTEELRKVIFMILEDHVRAVKALSGMPELVQTLQNSNEESLAQANSIIDHFNDSLQADVCYLMSRDGTTIASSNRSDPDSFVGKNYSFRPYFKNPSVDSLMFTWP